MTNKSRNRSLLSLALVASVLAACGSEQPSGPPPVEQTAFGDMAGTLDKARAVEGQVQDHKQAIDRTLEENENQTAR